MRGDLHRLQRVAPAFKEVVADAELIEAEHVLECVSDDLLHPSHPPRIRPRRRYRPVHARRGKRVTIDLPGRRERESRQRHERRRDHVIGQPFPQVLAQGGGCRRLVRHDVGGQPRVAWLILEATTRLSRTAG